MEGYCVKCQKKVEIESPTETTIKNGKVKAIKGVCPVCKTGVFRIVGKS